ncbi:hypothetical protein CSING_05035 [Corynebacterium singulare]|uniref:Uncharacterized protein n=1 Tax=Corynebacterium singulare TaxID=161899 RepID=A0A0B6F3E8_9CORY|nr:hypothetical protein CSING_05035 [Corynebacterium singulare]
MSATWTGEDDGSERSAVALMVHLEAGTLDQPHLVWLRVDDGWVAINPGTVEESGGKDNLALTCSNITAQAVHCLTAGSW